MTIYKVQQILLDFFDGRFDGYEELGYYANKEKAEWVKANTERDPMHGEVEIIEIEVNE